MIAEELRAGVVEELLADQVADRAQARKIQEAEALEDLLAALRALDLRVEEVREDLQAAAQALAVLREVLVPAVVVEAPRAAEVGAEVQALAVVEGVVAVRVREELRAALLLIVRLREVLVQALLLLREA